jgi:hypothetical protein
MKYTFKNAAIIPCAKVFPETITYDRLSGIDTRNITDPLVDMTKIERNIKLYSCLQVLEYNKTHPLRKLELAKLCLDELIYPNDRTSKFTMSPVKGGLFRGWNP